MPSLPLNSPSVLTTTWLPGRPWMFAWMRRGEGYPGTVPYTGIPIFFVAGLQNRMLPADALNPLGREAAELDRLVLSGLLNQAAAMAARLDLALLPAPVGTSNGSSCGSSGLAMASRWSRSDFRKSFSRSLLSFVG